MLKEKSRNVTDLEMRDAFYVYAFVSLVVGILAASFESLGKDPSYILGLASQGIAGGLSYLICMVALLLLLFSHLFASERFFVKKLDSFLFSCINVGIVSGLVSTTVTGFLGLGAYIVFCLVGTSEQLSSASNIIVHGVWFLLLFYPIVYLYKKMIESWKVLADFIAGIYFFAIMWLSFKYGVSDGDELSILFAQCISGVIIFIFLLFYKNQKQKEKSNHMLNEID